MTQLLLYSLTAGVCLFALKKPWIGILAYYILTILAPQFIWFWIFEDFRVQVYIGAATLAGLILSTLLGGTNLKVLNNRQNYYLFIMWIFVFLSHTWSTYAYDPIHFDMQDPDYLRLAFTKTILFYFVSIIIINDARKYRLLIISFILIIIYYTFWANYQYFSGISEYYRSTGRLSGPFSYHRGGIYIDENVFAMLFVIGIPFLHFFSLYSKNKAIKYLLLGTIPWTWHAIFLTGSRMGLLGLSVVSLHIVIKTKSKLTGIVFLIGLILAVFLYGGNLLERSAATFSYMDRTQDDTPIDPRLISWKVGFKMMLDHPVFGVGIGKFQPAFTNYSGTRPHVAHNTFLQFGAESGVVAGFMYLLIIFGMLKINRKYSRSDTDKADPLLMASSNALFVSIFGFFICSFFLNLAYFEVFYYLIALTTIRHNLSSLEVSKSERMIDDSTL